MARKVEAKKVVNPLFEKRAKNFGIGENFIKIMCCILISWWPGACSDAWISSTEYNQKIVTPCCDLTPEQAPDT